MTLRFHLCVEVDEAMLMLRDAGPMAVPLFDCSRSEAMRDLVAAQKAGKKYHAGCDNETPEGRCAGHTV